jgi:translation initiation factor IF-2
MQRLTRQAPYSLASRLAEDVIRSIGNISYSVLQSFPSCSSGSINDSIPALQIRTGAKQFHSGTPWSFSSAASPSSTTKSRKLRKGESSFDSFVSNKPRGQRDQRQPNASKPRRGPQQPRPPREGQQTRGGLSSQKWRAKNPEAAMSGDVAGVPLLDDGDDGESLGIPTKTSWHNKKSWQQKSLAKGNSTWRGSGKKEFSRPNLIERNKPHFDEKPKQRRPKPKEPEVVLPKIIQVPEDVTVVRFAKLVDVPLSAVERVLTDIGEAPQSIEETICPESAELIAMELGKSIEILKTPKSKAVDENAVSRPPVITVMGHVDHGKTSLLDALRSTSVAAREAGGITQHVGAFEVSMPESGNSLTFLDTPGHAAFSAMRARGAAVTDIVVLVVAADDGVMPQTREAYAHAKASQCPIVVAITKCDLEGANVDKVKQEVAELGLEIEDYGGNVQVVEMAAPKGVGLRELETALLLEAEILEPKAKVDVPATGVVVESRVDKGQGPVAMVIVTAGNLERGQSVVVGSEWGKIRALKNASGKTLGPNESVSPGKPVEIIGLKGLPNAGDDLLVVATDERAQKLSKARTIRSQNTDLSLATSSEASRSEGEEEDEPKGPHSIPVIVKADVQGSAEALKESLSSLSNDLVKVNVVHVGVGPITSSDVDLALPFGGQIVGFNVKTAADAQATAKSKGITIVNKRIIYELIEYMESIIEGATPKPPEDVVIGSAQVLALFKVPGKKGSSSRLVAGCRVSDGTMKSGMKVEVIRSGEVVYTGQIDSLRRHKLDVETVGKGTECGLSLDGFEDIIVGDTISCIEVR